MVAAAQPRTMQDLLAELASCMQAVKEEKAEIDRIQQEAANEAAAYVLRHDEAKAEVDRLRAAVRERMEAEGVRTVENDDLQITRPKKSALMVVDEDKACAHLADLGRLAEVQRVTIDQQAVLWLAQTIDGGLEGVEEVTTFGFAVKALKK
jgi:hypothetical protein